MPITLPPVTQSPDDLMDLDVADLIFKLDLRVHRSTRWIKLVREAATPDARQFALDGAEREQALLHAATVAVRVRSREVAAFSRSLGLRCRPEEARRCPWVVACRIVAWVMQEGPRRGNGERHS